MSTQGNPPSFSVDMGLVWVIPALAALGIHIVSTMLPRRLLRKRREPITPRYALYEDSEDDMVREDNSSIETTAADADTGGAGAGAGAGAGTVAAGGLV
jgi:hypothetical protein